MRRDRDDELIVTTDAIPAGEIQEYDTFDEAVAALYSQLEPGGSIALHHEDCELAADGPECTCTPTTLTSGAKA
jgi:hypothetical protein